MGEKLNLLLNWLKSNISVAILVFFCGLITHFQLYSNVLSCPDAVVSWGEFTPGDWELSLGRWGWKYVMALRENLVSPMLVTTLTICYFGMAAILLCELFEVRHAIVRVLLSLSIVCSPLVAITLNSFFCTDAFALAFLFAVLSVICVAKIRSRIIGIVSGAFFVAFSVGIYQSNLGVAAATALMYLFFLMQNKSLKLLSVLKKACDLLVMGLSGTALYYGILKILLQVGNVSMASYKGGDKISVGYVFENLFQSIKNAYLDFVNYFFKSEIMINSYGLKYIYAIIFILGVVAIIIQFIRLREYKRIALCIGIVVLLPIGVNLIDIAAPDTRIILLTSSGLAVVIPFLLSVLWRQIESVPDKNKKIIFSFMVCFLFASVVWKYVLIDAADAMVLQVTQNETISLATRVYHSIEADERFSSGDHFMIIGAPQGGNYPLTNLLSDKTNKYAHDCIVYSGDSYRSWAAVLQQYLGIDMYCGQDFMSFINNGRDIKETERFKNMPAYPDEGCMDIFGDIFVVKIAN